MRRRLASVLAFIAAASAACTDQASLPASPQIAGRLDSKAPPPSYKDVTTTVYDTDALGALLLTRSDQFNGSGFATYATVNNVTSRIQPDGSWQLLLLGQTARTIHLVLASQGIPLPDGNYSADVEVYTQCFDQSLNRVSLLQMTAGATNANCSFGVDFSTGGHRAKYKLVSSPKFAGTGTALVTCMAAANGSCTKWTIVPNTSGPNAGVANLYLFGNGLELQGVYHNSFSIVIQ